MESIRSTASEFFHCASSRRSLAPDDTHFIIALGLIYPFADASSGWRETHRQRHVRTLVSLQVPRRSAPPHNLPPPIFNLFLDFQGDENDPQSNACRSVFVLVEPDRGDPDVYIATAEHYETKYGPYFHSLSLLLSSLNSWQQLAQLHLVHGTLRRRGAHPMSVRLSLQVHH